MQLCSVGNQSKNSLSLRCPSKMSLSYAADDFLGGSADVKTLVSRMLVLNFQPRS